MDFKNEVVELISSQVDLPKDKINALIERPKNEKNGRLCISCICISKNDA